MADGSHIGIYKNKVNLTDIFPILVFERLTCNNAILINGQTLFRIEVTILLGDYY